MKDETVFGLLLAIGALSAQTTAQTHIFRSMGVPKYPPLAYAARTQGTLKLSVKLKETRALFRCEQHFPSTIIDRSSRAENDDEALHDIFSRARQRVRELRSSYSPAALPAETRSRLLGIAARETRLVGLAGLPGIEQTAPILGI